MALALGVLPLLFSTALATDPEVIRNETGSADYVPLTRAQQQIVALKLREAARQEATAEKWLVAHSGQNQPGSGIQPDILPPPGGGPGGLLATYARAQGKSTYCGPAAVQVVSNYAWGMSSGGNKYSQQHISDNWTKTDYYGFTYVWRERLAMSDASAGHLPANFIYAEYEATSGSDWYNKLITDVSSYSMPQVVGVAPHDPGATYWLSSWPIQTTYPAGHYITLRGWSQYWDGTRGPTACYDDSSGDGGYSAGAYSDPAYDVWWTIHHGNVNHAANWVIW